MGKDGPTGGQKRPLPRVEGQLPALGVGHGIRARLAGYAGILTRANMSVLDFFPSRELASQHVPFNHFKNGG